MNKQEEERIQKQIAAFWSDPGAARRHLANIYHPDKNPPNMRELCDEIMKDVNLRYEAEVRERRR